MNLDHHVEISTLPYTGREPCIYWGDRGFGVRVYPSGARKFVLSYRASGRKRLLTVGDYPALSLDKANDMAAAYRLQIGEGGDPVLENRYSATSVRAAPKPNLTAKKTVTALCDTYLSLHASKKRSGDTDERLIRVFVRPAWGNLRVETLTRAQVRTLDLGGHVLENVEAVVLSGENVPILLGQSALRQLGKWSINAREQSLEVTP